MYRPQLPDADDPRCADASPAGARSRHAPCSVRGYERSAWPPRRVIAMTNFPSTQLAAVGGPTGRAGP